MKKSYYVSLFLALVIVYFVADNRIKVAEISNSAQIRELERKDQSHLVPQMDLARLLAAREYAIVGGGTLIVPGDFRPVDVKKAAVLILHGTDYAKMKEFIQNEFAADSQKTYVITALALKRILLEKSDRFFDAFMERYKKSGDIFVDRGAPFYYMDQIQFYVKENLEGIIISFPFGYYFSKVKNYGLAHLIENDFSIKGFENPIRFLETINFPKPDNFSGSFEDLINLARREYHEKYLANILGIDYKNGMIVRKDLIPFIQPRKKDKVLPLFTVIKLSKNVYFSGLAQQGNY